jgi:hypothetical protein
LFNESIRHISLFEHGGKGGVFACIGNIERLLPKQGGLVKEVDGMDGILFMEDILHGEVALNFFEPGKAPETIMHIIVLVGFGGCVQFNDRCRCFNGNFEFTEGLDNKKCINRGKTGGGDG